MFYFVNISFSMTMSYECTICYSAGSPPSQPRPSHPPPWASDGREPALHFFVGQIEYGAVLCGDTLFYRCI